MYNFLMMVRKRHLMEIGMHRSNFPIGIYFLKLLSLLTKTANLIKKENHCVFLDMLCFFYSLSGFFYFDHRVFCRAKGRFNNFSGTDITLDIFIKKPQIFDGEEKVFSVCHVPNVLSNLSTLLLSGQRGTVQAHNGKYKYNIHTELPDKVIETWLVILLVSTLRENQKETTAQRNSLQLLTQKTTEDAGQFCLSSLTVFLQ